MKSRYFLSLCTIVVSNIFCMQDLQNQPPPPSGKEHIHECAFGSQVSDWNCYGGVSDKLSLQANKIWLMTLFLSEPEKNGLPSGGPGYLWQLHKIERAREETNANIYELLQCASRPAACRFIDSCSRFINCFFKLEEQWINYRKKLFNWVYQVSTAHDVDDCQRLEEEFIAHHMTQIYNFYTYFGKYNDHACRYYLYALQLAQEDKVLDKTDSVSKHTLFYREFVGASVGT